ncbi:hypothetical protein HYH03_004511 [Edaphochlamys debaryana]|uniref:Ferric oxidoreductase domain-containing protein n=1 Tax=Edaphochlamys debaryana TaxID=47281 RepID=A0A836C210_9CHLO|nr:hypothetical protein HYH03_004511 [Edaphochlamys debaryana]|eukprot:KAG2497350.1 hypothetical protein HYH03_004511 [Edaphochlamys debaryana]
MKTLQERSTNPTDQGLTHLPDTQDIKYCAFKYTAWVGRIDTLLLFFPLPRCNFVGWLLGRRFPELIKYHRWMGHGTLVVYSIHGIGLMALWSAEGILGEKLRWNSGLPYNPVAGLVSMCGGWLLWITCLPYIRRQMYALFYFCHMLGVVILLLFGFMVSSTACC